LHNLENAQCKKNKPTDADNLYTTDNGAEIALWPDGAMTPFRSEKGTTWDGGFRIPMMVRWPGVIKAGTQYNDIISLIDWFPAFCAAAGIPDIKERMAAGLAAGDKAFKVHLDGYNFLPYFQGTAKAGPRDTIYYFDQGGNLNAIRWNDWKLSFAQSKGNIATGTREVTGWALITNLRKDPYERGLEEGGGAMNFLAQNRVLPALPAGIRRADMLASPGGCAGRRNEGRTTGCRSWQRRSR
jgi:arylsulfatase A-like enzyme